MGQIVRRKKKGRPSKADLARRPAESPSDVKPDLRRSLRRRDLRHNTGYGDYLGEDERRSEKKKQKLAVKIKPGQDEEEDESAPIRTRVRSREVHDSEDHGERKHVKKRKISGNGNGKEKEDENDNGGGEQNDDAVEHENEDDAVSGGKFDSKGLHSVSGSPPRPSSGIPLPDKRTLELILSKLQKKDKYGVFSEPVDPEELPDYHDVIEHPMDFATLRTKLANGSYHTLEHFESDVRLIYSNAMQYNAPETIYHKQARSIQEQAQKNFQKLRNEFEHSQSEWKSEQKTRSNSLVKKQTKKPLARPSQEPVGFDFCSGAILTTIGDVQPTSHPTLCGSCEKLGNIDGLVQGNISLIDSNQEKTDDFLSGKGLLSKLGKKSFLLDENCRATSNMSKQPITRSDSIFMTFGSEFKQLVTVGLHVEYSYARSLAHFGATLGPIAWKIASQRIQQALPAGYKFGRGWVGEYEPLPTPVLMLDNHVQKEPSLFMKAQSNTELITGDKNGRNAKSTIEHPVNGQMSEGKLPSSCSTRGLPSEGKPLSGSAGVGPNASVYPFYQQQNIQSRSLGKSENKGLKQEELNSLPSSYQNNTSLVKNIISIAPTAMSKPREVMPRNINFLPSIPSMRPDTVSGELPNGKVRNTSLNRLVTGQSYESTANQTGRAAPFAAHEQGQSLSDPVHMRRMFAEKAQQQLPLSNHSPVDTPSVTPWRPMVFPQFSSADQSIFQMQSPLRGPIPHSQPRQKPETLPPDLNIGFQSPGSPAKQSSGVLVDSQQPDLVLQL